MGDLELAHQLADEARRVSMRRFGSNIEARAKRDGTIVTDADEAVEDALRALLGSARPSDAVLGEERGRTGSSDRVWIIDAIDGTDSFANGEREWGTLIALEVGGEVVVGVADAPVRMRRTWAERGRGAFAAVDASPHQPNRLHVSSEADIRHARCFVVPLEWCRDQRDVDAATRVNAATRSATPTDHPAIQVAAGGYEAAVFFKTGPWDVAAPSLIVEEAGGRFSDLDGNRRLDAGCVMYTNGFIHDRLLAIVKR